MEVLPLRVQIQGLEQQHWDLGYTGRSLSEQHTLSPINPKHND